MDAHFIPTSASLLIRAASTSTASSHSSTSTSTSTPQDAQRPPVYHVVGIILAISSGLFIGTSFVLKKVGLLKANAKYNEEAGEGYGYLKNVWWWTGMTLMIIGEICNFVAYAFVDAILVTPMGSLSVVVTTILSAIFLKERLSFVGKVGCFNCIIGSVVIVVNSPQESSVADIQEMQSYVIAPGFLSYAGVIVVGCTFIAFWAGPRYGKKSMLVYLTICSLIGGLSVVATQGLGAAVVAQAGGESQFDQWFLYVLAVFVVATLVTEIVYLNKALNIFNAALVTPTYYVYFTSATIVTSAILFRGFKGSGLQIATIVMGFLQICSGVVLLQLSKSAKDVPDTAVFKGDLDQVRTVAEQEEHESEPKADAIRGTSALLRSISKSRMQKEAEEAKRVYEERLEPIGENEQVEWDGLRRRKTIVNPGETPQRRRSIHPPLGMSRFPNYDSDDESDAHSHNPENDQGLFPNLRRRAHTMFYHKEPTTLEESGRSDSAPNIVPLTTINSGQQVSSFSPVEGGRSLRAPAYNLSPDLKRATSIGLSSLQAEDTSYKSPQVSARPFGERPMNWNSNATRSTSSLQVPPHHDGHLAPGPTPPPHGRNRRQFSFQNVFSRNRSSSAETEHRPVSSSSSGHHHGFLSGLRKSSGLVPTEEESLGLVHGDSVNDRHGTTSYDGITASPTDDNDGGDLGRRATTTTDYDDDYDDNDYEEDRYARSGDQRDSRDLQHMDPTNNRYGDGTGPGGASFL